MGRLRGRLAREREPDVRPICQIPRQHFVRRSAHSGCSIHRAPGKAAMDAAITPGLLQSRSSRARNPCVPPIPVQEFRTEINIRTPATGAIVVVLTWTPNWIRAFFDTRENGDRRRAALRVWRVRWNKPSEYGIISDRGK